MGSYPPPDRSRDCVEVPESKDPPVLTLVLQTHDEGPGVCCGDGQGQGAFFLSFSSSLLHAASWVLLARAARQGPRAAMMSRPPGLGRVTCRGVCGLRCGVR